MRKPTINDVATLAGVSKKTVSHFVSGAGRIRAATGAKVAAAIAELGYVPDPQARALALRRNVIQPKEAMDGDGLLAERQAATDAAGWLLALGHRRIAFIAGPESHEAAREREHGYLDAIAGRTTELVAAGDMTFRSGREAAQLLLELSPRPTAILAASDDMAAAAIQIAHEYGIAVPGALSVVGFGDTPLAEQLSPPLSSMRVTGGLVVRASAGPAPD